MWIVTVEQDVQRRRVLLQMTVMVCREDANHAAISEVNTPNGIRTRVSGLRILHPGPLDDGGDYAS